MDVDISESTYLVNTCPNIEKERNKILIKCLNENKLNINELSYEKKMSVMKTAFEIANEIILEKEYDYDQDKD